MCLIPATNQFSSDVHGVFCGHVEVFNPRRRLSDFGVWHRTIIQVLIIKKKTVVGLVQFPLDVRQGKAIVKL